ncbi:hypothetical protein [Deinococcus aestuarii]|uniref:hypothetical protein n=1 Tax=Deinococcus aestuarii TaxID=2774531 RepID=UPI001C0D0249|nr:hypothetical protein [Deinococcus aestuarii]
MTLQPRHALLASAALALTACGSAGLPAAPDDQPPATTIRGTVSTWTGPGTVTLPGPSGAALAQADVAAEGTFTLTLPAAPALEGLTRSVPAAISEVGCTGTVTSGDPSARGYAFGTLTARDTAGTREVLAADLSVAYVPPKATLLARAWLYADRATRLTGTLNCGALIGAASAPVTVDVSARAGWNVVGIVVNASYGLGGVSASGRMALTTDAATTWLSSGELVAKLPGR